MMVTDERSQATRGLADDVDPRWAWAEYEPEASRPWTLAMAGHLYRRAAFGATFGQLEQAFSDGPRRTVDRLVRCEQDLSEFQRSLDEYEEASASGGVDSLRAWWLRRMVETPHPLLEKMTLFWHNHFGISGARVGDGQLMLQHIRLLRRHALGQYPALLDAVAGDPAVFISLGADASRKTRPNENFARQLMQRLSVGPGNFGEQDVREASRAFTGWFVLRGRLRYFDREHDTGVKKVLGQTGNWQAQDVVRIVLEQPVAPRMLSRKLYRWLISEVDDPSDRLLAPLAEMLAEDYDVGRVVEAMLRSNQFFSAAAYRRRIKSPVEFALEIVRAMESTVSTVRLGEDLGQLGQNLYNPPTVDGWHGGRHWINAATVTGRSNLARALLASQGRYGGKLDPAALCGTYGRNDPNSSAELLVALFLQDDLSANVREALWKLVPTSGDNAGPWVREFTHSVVTLPEFQLS
jgi:hypothetical protein